MKLRYHTAALALASLLFASTFAGATVIYTGAAQTSHITLEELLNGGQITVNDLTFDNWSLGVSVIVSDHGALSAVDPARIRVAGLDDDPWNEGIRFDSGTAGVVGSSEFYVEDFAALPNAHSSDTLILEFRYDLSISGDAFIKDNTLDVSMSDAFVMTNTLGHDTQGVLQITENLMDATGFVGSKGVIVDRIFDADRLFDEAVFPPHHSIAIDANITLNTGTNGDRVELYTFEQRFSQAVPEPFGFGAWSLLITAWLFKRRRSC